ncbi:MAG: GNAT family N-acetyltransferase [Muribaculaceae bacterium]|nr:GNAT family N-acetyltransferase [Muribaculaceae bacterium]
MIRPFSMADLAEVTEICNHYIRTSTATFELEEVSQEQMARRFSSGMPGLVAVEDGRIAGYAYVHPWKERAAYAPTLELTIYLAPEYCGRGLGEQLAAKVISLTRRTGRYRSVIACITANNERSINLFRSLGFEQVSLFRSVGEKFGQLLDVVDLQLLL